MTTISLDCKSLTTEDKWDRPAGEHGCLMLKPSPAVIVWLHGTREEIAAFAERILTVVRPEAEALPTPPAAVEVEPAPITDEERRQMDVLRGTECGGLAGVPIDDDLPF